MLNSELPEAVCTVLRLETLTPSPARADRLRSRRLPSCGDESTERLAQYGRQGAVLRCRRLCGLPQARRGPCRRTPETGRSEEHTSELQSLMRISYAVYCLQRKNTSIQNKKHTNKKRLT